MNTALRGKNREMKAVIEAAMKQGYILKTGRKHYKLIPPDKTQEIVTFGSTISDHRAFKNIRAILRRQGVRV